MRQRMLLWLVPRVVSGLLTALGSTLRFEDVCEQGVVPSDRVPGPGVFCFWHRCLLLSAYRFRHKGIAILISRSFDGELIANTVERLGFVTVRGSSSRGGGIGLRGMERAYREGYRCAITADGPRGPAMVAKPGTAQLARLCGTDDVAAFYCMPERAWQLRSWDGLLVPKPFSRVYVSWPKHGPAEESAVQGLLERAVEMGRERIDRLSGSRG